MTYRADPDVDAWVDEAKSTGIVEAFGRSHAGRSHRLVRSGREHVGPCPVCGGRDTFGINPVKNVFICRKGGAKGGPVSLVMHVDGCEFLDAVETITGRPRPGGRRAESEQERQDRERRLREQREASERRQSEQDVAEARDRGRRHESARQVWQSTVPLGGTLGADYLDRRGVRSGPIATPELRFAVATLHRPSGRSFPAIVAKVVDPHGNACGVWRIFLGTGKKGRAPVDPNKMGLGNVRAGAVRLGGMAETIGVAEGIESALAWAEINEWAFPVWSLLSTSGMKNFQPPAGVRHVVIFPDFDLPRPRPDGSMALPPGEAASAVLARRLPDLGVTVSAAERAPGPPCDGVDILRKLKGLPPE